MKKHFWQKLFALFMAVSLLFSLIVSCFFSFHLGLPTQKQVSLFLHHLMFFLPLGLMFSGVLFFCAFLYLRAFVFAGDFVLKLFQPPHQGPKGGAFVPLSSSAKKKQKALFDLAHTKNPYLKNIRSTLNPFLLKKEHIPTETQPTVLTFSDIVDQVLYQSQKRYPNLKIDLDLKADIELPFCSSVVFQALWELIKNSQESSPISPSVSISTDNKGHNWFSAQVKDKGPGMSRELMEKASQLHWTTKEGSTGLGLAFVQSVLSRLGGIMKLTSPEKGGLTVSLFIPKDYLFHVQHSAKFEKNHHNTL